MNERIGNDLCNEIITQAINEMKEAQGETFSMENINLAELERRTGITRSRLRRLQQNGFKSTPHGRTGQKSESTVISGYTAVLDNLLRQGITNSTVCFERLNELAMQAACLPLSDTSRNTGIWFLQRDSYMIHRETEGYATSLFLPSHTRWIGDSPM